MLFLLICQLINLSLRRQEMKLSAECDLFCGVLSVNSEIAVFGLRSPDSIFLSITFQGQCSTLSLRDFYIYQPNCNTIIFTVELLLHRQH